MGFFGSFMGTDQKKDLVSGANDAIGYLNGGKKEAQGNLSTGFNNAYAQTGGAFKSVQQGAKQAHGDINQGTDAAVNALTPYMQQGGQANTLYGNALGLNGVDAQRSFGENYAASDPFRQQNSEFATNALMQSLNARGLSGSGYAANAVAEQSLRRGSQDYETYLNRLQGQQGQGLQAAQQTAGFQANRGAANAGIDTGYGNARAGIYGDRAQMQTGYGNEQANLNYGNAQQIAGIRTGLANGVAATRSVGINNIMGLGALAVSAATGMPMPKK